MPPRRVLIVDDDPQVRAMLALVVGLANIQAETAADADAALAQAAATAPDAAIIDARLRGRDGFALATELRARLPGVRILLMSGDAVTDGIAERAHGLGAEFLPKPFEPTQLLALHGGALPLRPDGPARS
ncbi:MAG: response regulator [Gemmatimonadota bacterium]